MRMLRREAARRGTSVAGVVREAIDSLVREDRAARRRAAEALFRVGAPVADWQVMKREIEAAHLEGGAR
jgi:hypothetical protein